jgi:hypothetical protein
MSLLNSASLCVTPNGYKAGTLYSVIPNTTLGDMTVVRATTATRVNSAGLIESMANNVPRLDYSNGTCPSILVEPQRTNNVLYSEQLDNASWNKLNTTVVANNAISPDGTTSADLVYPTTSGTDRLIEQVSVAVIAQTWTSSFFVKASGFSWVLVYAPNLGVCWFNASSGVFGTIGGGVTASVLGQVNGYWRISFTGTVVSSNAYFYAGPADANGSTTATVNGTNGLLIWGCQLELGSYATSYIPTTSAAVTRNADVISKTGISSLIGQTEGTIFVDAYLTGKDISNSSILLATDKVSSGAIIRIFYTQSDALRFDVFDGSSFQCQISAGAYNVGDRVKVAGAYKNNDFVMYVNGTQIGTDTSGSVPTTDKVNINTSIYGDTNGSRINSAVLFPTRLTNAELISLTS